MRQCGPVPHREMDAIQVDDAVVGEQPTLAPGFILLGQRLVQTTDGTRAGGHSQQFFGYFAHFLGTGATDKHVGEGFRHLGFIASIALKHLRVKGSGAVVFGP